MAFRIHANSAEDTLASNITDVATTIPLTDASEFPTPSGSEIVYATLEDSSGNKEIFSYTGKSVNDLTGVTRGLEGTSNIAFTAGDIVEIRTTKDSHDRKADGAASSTNGNLVQFSGTNGKVLADGGTKQAIRDLTPTAGFTGTGAEVRANTPTLITPVLGVANATSISLDGGTNKVELLETGTWTPELYGLTVAGSPTYSANTGRYAVYGTQNYELWVLTLQLIWTDLGGAEGSMAISGSPVNPSGAGNRFGFFAVWFNGLSLTNNPPAAFMDNTTNNIRLWYPANTTSNNAITHTQLTAAGEIYLNGTGIKPA